MLRHLLAPLDLWTFRSEYLERRHLHIARDDAAYLAPLFGIADLEDALVLAGRDPGLVALVKDGEPELAAESYTMQRVHPRARMTGRAPATVLDTRAIVRYYADGWTVVLRDAALFSAKLQRACNALIAELGAYVQPNVYLTPPEGTGFEPHYDTHDTLIVQIEGTKRWRLYQPLVTLPTELQPCPPDLERAQLAPLDAITLHPGDTLYLPRGVIHEAQSRSGRSLHVTFALAPVRGIDALDHAARISSSADLALRGAIGADESVALPDAAALPLGIEAAYDWMFRAVRADAAGSFDQIERLRAANGNSVLRMAEGAAYMLRPRSDGLALLVAGKTIPLLPLFAPSMERLGHGPVAIAELDPALSPEHRMLLVRILVLEGVAVLE